MRILGFDTETYLITPTEKAPKPVCCLWSDGDNAWASRPGDVVTYTEFQRLDNVYVGVNIAYDMCLMMRWHHNLVPHIMRAFDEGRVFDISLRHAMDHLSNTGIAGYNPRPSMADLAKIYLGIDMTEEKKNPDAWRMKFGTIDGVSFDQWPKEAMEYGLNDAKIPVRVFNMQGGMARIRPTEQDQVRSALVLQAISSYGFKIHQPTREKIKLALSEKAAPLREKVGAYWTGEGSNKRKQESAKKAWGALHTEIIERAAQEYGGKFHKQSWVSSTECIDDIIGYIKNLSSTQNPHFPWVELPPGVDISGWLRNIAGILPEIPRGKTGISVGEKEIEQIMPYMEGASDYLELRHLEKMLSTYIEPYSNETVHPGFITLHSTGRTGCRSPNTQNVPRKDKTRPDEAFRTMFVAREGRVLGTSDYSQLELCTLAATIRHNFPGMQCNLGNEIDKGTDLHSLAAASWLGVSYEHVMANKKKDGSPEANARQASKAVNFGKPGGLSDNALISYAKNNYGVVMTYQEALSQSQSYARLWPDVMHYLAVNGKAVGGFGKRVSGETISGRVKANMSFTERANYPFQGLASDGTKVALWGVWRESILGWFHSTYAGESYGIECKDTPLRASNLVNFIHDEFVGEHPEGKLGEEALKRQDEIMIRDMRMTCKSLITIRVESKLSHQWEH